MLDIVIKVAIIYLEIGVLFAIFFIVNTAIRESRKRVYDLLGKRWLGLTKTELIKLGKLAVILFLAWGAIVAMLIIGIFQDTGEWLKGRHRQRKCFVSPRGDW